MVSWGKEHLSVVEKSKTLQILKAEQTLINNVEALIKQIPPDDKNIPSLQASQESMKARNGGELAKVLNETWN